VTFARWLRARSRRLRLCVAAGAVVALAFASFAFSAHLHEFPAGKTDVADQICGLCLHFERFGTTPEPVLAPAATPLVFTAPAAPASLTFAEPTCSPYRSRAPPA
jgi:hypothetical protein